MLILVIFMVFKFKELSFLVATILLVSGSFGLAIVDPDVRPVFTDIARIGFSAYVTWLTSMRDDDYKDKGKNKDQNRSKDKDKNQE